MDQEADLYVKYYEAQVGGSLPVFRGAKRYNTQSDAGIGDIFRHIFRTVVPVAVSGISSFLGESLRAKNSGASWKDAAKSAVSPTAKNLIEGVTGAIQTHLSTPATVLETRTQSGTGRKPRKRKTMTDSSRANKRTNKRRGKSLGRFDENDIQDETESRSKRAAIAYKRGNRKFGKSKDSISGIKFNF